MTRIPERQREGVADWLDCRDLLREPLDPAEARGLEAVNRTVPSGELRKGSDAVNCTPAPTFLDGERLGRRGAKHGQDTGPDA